VLPLKAIIMNGLSIGGAYGALVFVFQQGHFEGLLRFTASTFIDRFIPILLFCVLFGLSMDYEVFLLSRMREEWLHTGNNQSAVARGLEKTGGVITSAALLFMIVSGSFIFAQLVVVKELGLGITVAVLVDATLIRSLLVPATMQLMGSLNWWFPSRRATIHGRGDALLGHQKAIEQKLIQIMAYALALSPEQLPRTAHFFDYGGNSESLTALLSAIYQQWHVPIEADDIFDHPVVLHLATVIALRQRQQQQQRAEGSKGYA
jgi:hypothetical protein